uniref:Uncharacterized protein n=1 Tax=Triticum urartu TaxID=4572 RepID=A0A8R7VAB3_TRIUA
MIAWSVCMALIRTNFERWWTTCLQCLEQHQWLSMLSACTSWIWLVAWPMDGVELWIHCGHAIFQGGRIFMVVATFVDHNYYLDVILNLVPIGHGDYFGNLGKQACYFDRVYTHLGYYHEDYHGDPSKIKELQAPWDPGKSTFQSSSELRLGVKPSFKEGGVLATLHGWAVGRHERVGPSI